MSVVVPFRRKPDRRKPEPDHRKAVYVWRDTDGCWWATFDRYTAAARRLHPVENASALETAYKALVDAIGSREDA